MLLRTLLPKKIKLKYLQNQAVEHFGTEYDQHRRVSVAKKLRYSSRRRNYGKDSRPITIGPKLYAKSHFQKLSQIPSH